MKNNLKYNKYSIKYIMKNRMNIQHTFILIFFLLIAESLFSANIYIDTPEGGFTGGRIQTISGRVEGYKDPRIVMTVNGIPQSVPLQRNKFSVTIVAAPGNNLIEVRAGSAVDRVSFYADVPSKDIKVILTWDTPTDVDLWVIDPKGVKCYYANRSTQHGGNLDVDITAGFGPETFTMSKALPGNYAVQAQYYYGGENPVTKVRMFVILFEGTEKEERKEFQFIMTRSGQVYHIADFNIDPQG